VLWEHRAVRTPCCANTVLHNTVDSKVIFFFSFVRKVEERNFRDA